MSEDCEMCSGSGCVYCKAELEKVEAPEPVKDRLNFTKDEIGEFFFKDKGEAELMVSYLNSRCSSNHTCPLLRSKCVTDCPCFRKAEVSVKRGCVKNNIDIANVEGFVISGFRCGNLMFGLG